VNINLTLIVQMIVFIVLVWFTMKFVWPMILGPMEERAKKIAASPKLTCSWRAPNWNNPRPDMKRR